MDPHVLLLFFCLLVLLEREVHTLYIEIEFSSTQSLSPETSIIVCNEQAQSNRDCWFQFWSISKGELFVLFQGWIYCRCSVWRYSFILFTSSGHLLLDGLYFYLEADYSSILCREVCWIWRYPVFQTVCWFQVLMLFFQTICLRVCFACQTCWTIGSRNQVHVFSLFISVSKLGFSWSVTNMWRDKIQNCIARNKSLQQSILFELAKQYR